GSASSDPDGTLTSYAWDFGDGATGTGATASHSYPQASSYTVRLTVTDNQGSSDSVTKQVTVAAPTVFAKDDFTRTVANGWGPADQGGSWAIAPNTTTALGKFSVADGMGKLSLSAGNSNTASL